MIGQSGCFGNGNNTPEQIGTAAEAAAAVADIVDDAMVPSGTDAVAFATVKLSAILEALRERVQLLSWAVALLALVVILREVE